LLASPTIIIEFFPTQTLARIFCVEEATIVALQSAQQFHRLSASDLVQAYLSRINTYDKQGPNINSVLEMNPDALEIAADLDRKRFKQHIQNKPLYGIPILLKDNIDTADRMHTSAGTLALANSIRLQDSFVAQKWRSAGAIVLGKANMTSDG